MKIILIALSALILSICGYSQSNDIKAKASYMAARETYNAGNYKYCLEHLEKAEKLLGSTQPVILHLKAKSHYNLKYFIRSKKDLENFFRLNPDESSTEFKEMLTLLEDLTYIINNQELLFEKIKNNPSVSDINEFFSTYPNDTEAYEELYLIAARYFKVNLNFESALTYLKLYLDLYKKDLIKGDYLKDINELSMDIQNSLFDQAKKALSLKEYEAAYKYCMKYSKLFPGGIYLDDIDELYNTIGNHFLYDERDGQGYLVKQYGNQIWMVENLNYETKGSWAWDDYNLPDKNYGRLYSWYSAKDACPSGWHLPSKEEWLLFVNDTFSSDPREIYDEARYIDGWEWAGGNGSNSSGFAILPAGDYNIKKNLFSANNMCANFWTSTTHKKKKAWAIFTNPAWKRLQTHVFKKDKYGYSVRCVKD